MKVVCIYCEREGRSALIGEKEPLDDPMISHGICPGHRRVLLEEIEGLSTRATPPRGSRFTRLQEWLEKYRTPLSH